MILPPATSKVMPVIHEAASEARNNCCLGDVAGLANPAQRKRGARLFALLVARRGSHSLVLGRRRCDAVDSDPVAGGLVGELARERDDSSLRRGVGGAGASGLPGGGGGHRDDRPLPAFDHRRQERADGEEGGSEVCLDHLAPVGGRLLNGGDRSALPARERGKNVRGSELLTDRPRCCLQLGVDGAVGLHWECLPTVFRDAGRGRREGFVVAGDDRGRGAVGGQRPGGDRADPARAPVTTATFPARSG